MKKLKKLEDHNDESVINSIFDTSPKLNGIECPNCGAELFDTNPTITLMSNPPKKNISCSKCDYVGYRNV